ncbi:MAG TPA: hypothetical protein VEI97_20295 [bacterium]|nr:hypothetical protein [bacterium]
MGRCMLVLCAVLVMAGCARPGEDERPQRSDGVANAPGSPETAGSDDGVVTADALEPSERPGAPGGTQPPPDLAKVPELVINGSQAVVTGRTTAGWRVTVEPAPQKPDFGANAWKVTATPPDGRALEIGDLDFYVDGRKHGDEIGMPELTVTGGEPGIATIAFPIEKPGSYAVTLILAPAKGEGDRSEIRYTFAIQPAIEPTAPGQ